MHATHEELLRRRRTLPIAVTILDLLTAAVAAAVAADRLTVQRPMAGPDWSEGLVVAFGGAAAALGVLAGLLLICPRIAWAARLGQVAGGFFVALSVVWPISFYRTCEEMACLGAPIALGLGVAGCLLGASVWFANRYAYGRLSGELRVDRAGSRPMTSYRGPLLAILAVALLLAILMTLTHIAGPQSTVPY